MAINNKECCDACGTIQTDNVLLRECPTCGQYICESCCCYEVTACIDCLEAETCEGAL